MTSDRCLGVVRAATNIVTEITDSEISVFTLFYSFFCNMSYIYFLVERETEVIPFWILDARIVD